MREILFKAKSIATGEWVEGYYSMSQNTEGITHWILESIGTMHKIDKKTICQYTGLTDKNGNKIWENDVLNVHQFLFDGSEYEKEIIVSIEYMKEMMCFGANLIEAKEISVNV